MSAETSNSPVQDAFNNIGAILDIRPLDHKFQDEEADKLCESVTVLNQFLEHKPDHELVTGILSRALLYNLEGVNDVRRAKMLAEKLADKGNLNALHTLGMICLLGLGGAKKDIRAATNWLNSAAKKSFPPSLTAMSYILAESGAHSDAFDYLKQAADQGYAPAQTELAYRHIIGQGVTKNYSTALHYCLPAAEKGHILAQYLAGYLNEEGYGKPRNYRQALKWYTAAAEQGLAEAQYRLGNLYRSGGEVKVNLEAARTWLQAAANQGHEEAVKTLAEMNEIDQIFGPVLGGPSAGGR